MGRANQKHTCLPDDRIVELYWERSESAISETADKYGDYCHYIAYNILYNREDAEESLGGGGFRIFPEEGQRLAQLLHGLSLQPVQRPQQWLGRLQERLTASVKERAPGPWGRYSGSDPSQRPYCPRALCFPGHHASVRGSWLVLTPATPSPASRRSLAPLSVGQLSLLSWLCPEATPFFPNNPWRRPLITLSLFSLSVL